MSLNEYLNMVRKRCAIQDDDYWRIDDDDTERDNLHATTRDFMVDRINWEWNGFQTSLIFYETPEGGFYCVGDMRINPSIWFARELFSTWEGRKQLFNVFSENIDIQSKEIWFHTNGVHWNIHDDDADLRLPLEQQPFKKVCGPVQVYAKLRGMKNNILRFQWKKEQETKAQQLPIWEEELMQRVWHPLNIKKWLEAGMDI
jgi:hypothetical protein